MGAETEIGWTDATFNAWIGCEKVSPACNSCYAETLDKRYRWGGDTHWGKNAPRHRTSDAYWRQPLRWDRNAAERGSPTLVFCSSLADVFEDRRDLDEHRADLWQLIEATPHLIWQLLTKRPQNVRSMVPPVWLQCDPATFSTFGGAWGWPGNVWIGTTVENQRYADLRIPTLLSLPAPVRFVSFEPLLGKIDLDDWMNRGTWQARRTIEWAIIGGESGPGHRPLNLRSTRALVGQLQTAGVPTFFKQTSGPQAGMPGPDDLEAFKQFPRQAQR